MPKSIFLFNLIEKKLTEIRFSASFFVQSAFYDNYSSAVSSHPPLFNVSRSFFPHHFSTCTRFFKLCISAFLWSVMAMPLLLQGCKHSSQVKEVHDKDLTLQITDLTDPSDHSGMITYKARLIPGKTLLREESPGNRVNLVYKMDSCYYLQSGQEKIYASLVQEVPNGIQGTYEYLLEFEKKPAVGKCWLIYQDRYLNHKKYNIEID
jgi:hypothetical protein